MRNLIRTGAAAALLASATLVGGVAGGHAFASTNCPAGSGTGDVCTPQTTVAITGNSVPLTLANAAYSTFTGKTLNGAVQSTSSSGTNSVTVTDQSGSGLGWNLSVQATPLECTQGTDTGCNVSQTLIPSLEGMTTAAIDAAHSTCVTQCRGTLTALNNGQIDNGSAVKVGDAAVNSGMGQYNVILGSLGTNLTADMWASTYHTTVTVTLAQTP